MRGRGGGFFANRSFVRKAPTLAPSTPTGFVRRGNSLISVAALSSSSSSRFSSQNSPSACSAPSPSLPPPPTKPPSAPGASTVQLKYSFRHAQPPPTRSFALAHRGRYAPPGWRRQQPVRPPPSFLSRVLHQRARNLTLKTPSGSSPIALRISKERQLSVGGIQYRIARGGRSLLRISRDRSTPKKTQGQYVRSANGMSLIRQQRAPALRECVPLLTDGPCKRCAAFYGLQHHGRSSQGNGKSRIALCGQRPVPALYSLAISVSSDAFLGKCNRVATCRFAQLFLTQVSIV